MLNLDFSDVQRLLQESFSRFFQHESSIERVRAAEPLGFDPALHQSLCDLGAFGLRVPESMGGSEGSLMDVVLVSEAAGRYLASAPLIEGIIAAQILAKLGDPTEHLNAVLSGEAIITLALHEARAGVPQIVPAGAIAHSILALEGDTVFLLSQSPAGTAQHNHGSQPIARLTLAGDGVQGTRTVIATGPEAKSIFLAGIEEWKVLTGAQLNGVSRRALEYAVDYAKERSQFDRLIGSYQAIAHPLADCAVNVDAAQLFTWWTVQQVSKQGPEAPAAIAMSYWWATKTADETTRRAMHTFGGYGVTLEYDLQLYFRRAKAWPILLGDPNDQLIEAGRRLWLNSTAELPVSGDCGLNFDFGEDALRLADETRALLQRIAPKQPKAPAYKSWENFEPSLAAALGDEGLYHPSWPVEWGGRGAANYEAALALAVWDEFKMALAPQGTAHFIGSAVRIFGSDELKNDVLLPMAKGLAHAALGYSEPSSGSDIFAARTRAQWDDAAQEWVINGQKMFTSGAEQAEYIFLLTRTDPDAPKHAGITMFLIPTNTPGVEMQPIETVGEELTNATFYTDVRVPDRYRVGDVNGGAKVLGAALVLEQGSIYRAGEHAMVEEIVAWARDASRLDDPSVLARITRVKINQILREVLGKRGIYFGISDPTRRNAYGPMLKLFYSEAMQRDMADMFDLIGPDILFPQFAGIGDVEINHRLAQVGTIYGGSSEVQRSTIAEIGLGLPRSR